jgi:mannose-1-phosphate guanylyltransferase
MQAVILAGGLGTRLNPLTKEIPKVMVTIKGTPFLLYLVHLLNSQGISNVVLCIGYLAEMVKDFLRDAEGIGVEIQYSEEGEKLLGTGGALKKAQGLLDDCFFVINGDTYLPIDYREVWKSSIKCGKKALMVVYNNREDTGVRNNVELDANLMVIRHDKEKPDSNLNYVEAGVLVLRRGALDILGDESPISLEEGLYPTLIEQRELAAYVSEQRFYDIGTPERLKAFQEFRERRLR